MRFPNLWPLKFADHFACLSYSNKLQKWQIDMGNVLNTFEPVPTMFFNDSIKNHRINSFNQKIYFLKKIKLDFLIVIKFNKTFSNISAENFIKKIQNTLMNYN